MELSLQIKRLIRRYEPVETEGLTVYPILTDEWEEFQAAKPAIEFMQQSLPVALIGMPLLSAMYQLDIQSLMETGEVVGLYQRALQFLALSLRLGTGLEMKDRLRLFRTCVDPKEPAKLLHISFRDSDGSEREITPVMFSKLRYILAEQNGLKIPSEDANPELVQAERDMAEANSPALDYNFDTLRTAIAVFTHSDESEIDSWPVKKFLDRYAACERIMQYMVCGMAEAQGGKWKDGNPCPSAFFNRLKTSSSALMPIGEFAGGEAAKAVAKSMQ